jgi:hypothetical protein
MASGSEREHEPLGECERAGLPMLGATVGTVG